MRKGILIGALAVFLIGFAWSVRQKEQLIENGARVIVALAPSDPRALLLGDYMELNYAINSDIEQALRERYSNGKNPRWPGRGSPESQTPPRDGIAVVRLDASSVATFVRLDDDKSGISSSSPNSPNSSGPPGSSGSPASPGVLAADERRVYFRVRDNRARIAAGSFFFQEGFAQDFEKARFGELRVDADGKNLLIHLLDAGLQRIQPEKKPAMQEKVDE